jgi:hypothetical protein
MEALPTLLTCLALLLTSTVRDVPDSPGKVPIVAPLSVPHDQPVLIRRPFDTPPTSNLLLVNLDETAIGEDDQEEIEDPEVFCLILFDSETVCARTVLNLAAPGHSVLPTPSVIPILRC